MYIQIYFHCRDPPIIHFCFLFQKMNGGIEMAKIKTIKVGHNEIIVDNDIYNAANRDLERTKKKRQRLHKSGYNYTEKSLDKMYAETEFEVIGEEDTAKIAVNNVLVEQIWQIVNETIDETDAFIVTAYYHDSLTETQIADKLSISQQAVSKRRKKAEEQLRAGLEIFKNFF